MTPEREKKIAVLREHVAKQPDGELYQALTEAICALEGRHPYIDPESKVVLFTLDDIEQVARDGELGELSEDDIAAGKRGLEAYIFEGGYSWDQAIGEYILDARKDRQAQKAEG